MTKRLEKKVILVTAKFLIENLFFFCIFLKLSLVLSFKDTSISLCMGVFQVGGGLVLYTIGSKTLSAADLTLLSLAEVVLGPVWVWLFLGEIASKNRENKRSTEQNDQFGLAAGWQAVAACSRVLSQKIFF